MQPKDSGGGSGETRESVVYRLATEMLYKLPPDYVAHEVSFTVLACSCHVIKYCFLFKGSHL